MALVTGGGGAIGRAVGARPRAWRDAGSAKRVLITATGAGGVITVENAGSEPRKHTVQRDAPFAAGAVSARSSAHRIYLEGHLELAAPEPRA